MAIRRKRASWEVIVYAGRDPRSGRERYVSRSVPAKPGQSRPPKEARDLEARLRVEVGQGKHVGSDMTVAGLLEAWFAQVSPRLSPWTVDGYRGIIDRYLVPRVGTKHAARLTPAQVQRLYDDLQAAGGAKGQPLGAQTVRNTHSVLRRAYAWGIRRGWVTRNPADGELVDLPEREATGVEAVDDDDLAQLLAAATDPDDRLLVLLADGTGCRRGELCGIRWADVVGSTVTVRRSVADPRGVVTVKTTKTKRIRTFSIGKTLTAALAARRERVESDAAVLGLAFSEDWYVLGMDDPPRPATVGKRFARLATRAGVARSLNEHRHGHATHLLAHGVPVRDVAERLGHASPRMVLEVYGHAIPAADRKAAQVTDRRQRER